MLSARNIDRWWKEPILIAIVICICIEAIIDSFTPRGFADWMSYAIPISLTSWYSKNITIVVTTTVTILTIIGFMVSPQLHQAPIYLGIGIFNRSIGITIFWIMAALINRRRTALEQMQAAHTQLKQGAEQLVEAERMKTVFLADTSHELRTPLAIIQSHLDLALGKKSRPVVDPYHELEGIQSEVRHLSRIITDLISAVRTSPDNHQGLSTHRVNLHSLLSSIVEKHAPLAHKASITIESEVPNLMCTVDAERVEKVFSNLLANAIQYGRAGGYVHITAREKGDRIEIVFADNGVGIPPQDLPHIFERFYRVTNARMTNTAGIGLGLAICKTNVEAHGGTITIASTLNEGSTFTVSLPSKHT